MHQGLGCDSSMKKLQQHCQGIARTEDALNVPAPGLAVGCFVLFPSPVNRFRNMGITTVLSHFFFSLGHRQTLILHGFPWKKIKCKCWGNKNVSQPTGTRPEALTTSVITHLNATQLQSDCLFFRRRILHCARVTLSSSVICPTSEDCKNLFGKTETCRAEPNALSSRATSFGLFEIKGERG